jgi:hypothetical protein
MIKTNKLVAKDIQTAEFHQESRNRYLILGFVLAHSPIEYYLKPQGTTVI